MFRTVDKAVSQKLCWYDSITKMLIPLVDEVASFGDRELVDSMWEYLLRVRERVADDSCRAEACLDIWQFAVERAPVCTI